MVTNGSLLDKAVLRSLLSLNCKLLQITLDGSREQHNKMRFFKNGLGSFDALLSKIVEIASLLGDNSNMTLLVRFNLNNTSIDEIKKTLLMIDEKYRSRISLLFRTVFNTSSFHEKNINSVESIVEFNELGNDLGYHIYRNQRTFSSCEACSDWNFMHVLPDLSLWKCVNNFNIDAARFGVIDKEGNLHLETQKILNWYKYTDFLDNEKCKNCSIAPDCLGGCIMYYMRNGKRRCGSLTALSSIYKFD